jgi:hypothetical protein
MRSIRNSSAAALALGIVVGTTGALAQPAPAPPAPSPVPPGAPPPAAAPTNPQPTPAPAPVPTTPAPVEPVPVAPVEPAPIAPSATVAAPGPKVTDAPAPVPLAEPVLHGVPPEVDALPWYDAIEFRAFVDAYASINYDFPKPQSGANSISRAFDTSNGFALSWVGVDASYPAEPVGGTVSLRFGPTAERIAHSCYGDTCDSAIGMSIVKQAFASWRPLNALSFDFGKFDTIYGAEVADSQDNINYTRGIVYWFTQPLFHTGLRVNANLTDWLTLRGLLVNGYNNTIDNNSGKSIGLQLGATAQRSSDGGTLLSASLGYLVGPEQNDYAVVHCDPATQYFDERSPTGCSNGAAGGNATSGTIDRGSSNTKGLRHMIDAVATLTPTEELTLQANVTLDLERVRDTADPTRFVQHTWWGLMLGARYSFVHQFAIAARGEYLSDPDAYATGVAALFPPTDPTSAPPRDVKMLTGTLTLDYRPSDYLILRLDNRIDWSNKEIFPKSVRELTGIMPTTTLGVVVTTN